MAKLVKETVTLHTILARYLAAPIVEVRVTTGSIRFATAPFARHRHLTLLRR